MAEPSAPDNIPAIPFTSIAERDAAAASGQYAPNTALVRLDGGAIVQTGYVDLTGASVMPSRWAVKENTPEEFADPSLWTQVQGAGGAVFDSDGITLTADNTNPLVEFELNDGPIVRGSRGWIVGILLGSTASLATNFHAAAGWRQASEVGDFLGVGWGYATFWRGIVAAYNYNGGAPALAMNFAVTDLTAFIAEAMNFEGGFLSLDSGRGYPHVSVFDSANVIRSHGALGTLTQNVLRPDSDSKFAIRASVPTGGAEVLTATFKLFSLPGQQQFRVP